MNMSLLLVFVLCIGVPCVFANGDELSALLSIKKSLIDPLDRLKDWTGANGLAHCNWRGVSCNDNGVVVKLHISNMNLTGCLSNDIQLLTNLVHLNVCCNGFSSTLPKSLSNLAFLTSFDVSQNNFMGDFPTGLGMSPGLKIVSASNNNFSGFLPEDLGNATLLESLDFRGSFFGGSIPKAYKNLQKLKYLGLSGNNLTGRIPGELGQLSSLETIILGYNQFEGRIPAEFGNLSNLRYLDLAVGSLGGLIPPQLGKLAKLETIFLYKNNFEGTIPRNIGNVVSLLFLDFSENMLTGEIPVELAKLKHLKLLNLMSNRLTGEVPSQLDELTELEVLELWNNSLTGPLPKNLGKSSPLQWLDVSSNLLSGDIPSGLCDFGNLTKLILFSNGFSGPIPLGLSTCLSLVRVRMQNNFISGAVPLGFGKLPKLQRLELANNSLTGEIPDDIPLSTSLSFIDLSQNHFQASLPSSILAIPNLQNFLASGNNLDGEIPDQFQDYPSLSVLDLSSNQLSGNIPASIASCERLVNLNLRNNGFTGEIPRAIAAMPTLSILDLSNNSFSGRIPENFGSSPALEALNISYNKLEGPVPSTGMLQTINLDDLKGNAGLCGGVLPSCAHKSVAVSSSRERNVHIKHVIFGWLGGTSAFFGIVLAVFTGRWLYSNTYRHIGLPYGIQCYWYGSDWIVYKAEMQRPHAVVAVKKLWRSKEDIETGSTKDDLAGEVNLLSRLRHRNIVRLLGYLHNDSDVMMVYEYMQNGSLGETLHGKEAGKLLIDWVSRYNIAVGVAHGIAYLHHDCNPPVIHRDVKSNNILLDVNLDARVADFGLARMMIQRNETVSMVAGSYGYIAPEYGYTLKVDEKIDIYSYGVVLMELLTGKRPLDSEFGESVNIVEWFRDKLRNNKPLEDALDPNVGGHCKHVQEEMLLVLRIALLCTAKLPKDRPSMRDVVTMLGEAKPRRKSSSKDITKEKPIFSTSPVTALL
ncbi:hypothetical protein GIB67_024671 [Kingdonia uniflora]|uniref:non-specific serine/threonine protein kinase n=1 Tax=Kingdonia uniflora TaxID=39325 RepID=A0A7J7LPM0_9MAGN|nr:hypothetical protein GIB67_024671 [Kingdonia uniflora]